MSLTQGQVDALLAPLHPGRVRQLRGNSHLEAWDIRRHLIRVFGWGGWDFTVLSCEVVSERSQWEEKNPLKGRHSVVYRVTGRLTIRDPEGTVLAHFDDGATGDSQNQPSLGDAHDQALKTAMSQALKRCAANLGDRFGLSLYANGSTEAMVGRSLAHPSKAVEVASEDVQGGDLADHEALVRDVTSNPKRAERVKGEDVKATDAWAEKVATIPDTSVDAHAWYIGWAGRVASCPTLPQLKGLWGELVSQHEAGQATDEMRKDGLALRQERADDLQQPASESVPS